MREKIQLLNLMSIRISKNNIVVLAARLQGCIDNGLFQWFDPSEFDN